MKTSNRFPLSAKMVLALTLLAPAIASAHPGVSGHSHGFGYGVAHPLSGLDHMLAMIAVGIFAVQRGGRALWQIPLAFVSVMALGGIFGMAGFGQIPFIEQAIAASVLILGIFVATATQFSLRTIVPLIGLFALFHGYAHGAEMPASASGISYGIGFLAATISLHLIGIAAGVAAQKMNSMKTVRAVGCAIAACGVWLMFAA